MPSIWRLCRPTSNPLSITGVNNPRTFTVDRDPRHASDRVHRRFQNCATNGRGRRTHGEHSHEGRAPVLPRGAVRRPGRRHQCHERLRQRRLGRPSRPWTWRSTSCIEDCLCGHRSTTVEDLSRGSGRAARALVPCGMPGAQWVKHHQAPSISPRMSRSIHGWPDLTLPNPTAPSPKIQRERHVVPEQRPERKGGRESRLLQVPAPLGAKIVGELDTIRFSFDLGQTWQDIQGDQ